MLVKQHLNQYISVEQTNQYVVWLSFKSHPIIHIGFVYIPPIGTTSTRDTCPFDDLQDEIVSKHCTGQVYISGDFNSWTAEIRDIDMYRDFSGNMLLCKHRLNNDKVTNTYGKKLTDLCRSNEMATHQTGNVPLAFPEGYNQLADSMLSYNVLRTFSERYDITSPYSTNIRL